MGTDIIPNFECECDEQLRSSCTSLPHYGEHEGRRYCVLHLPSNDKESEFSAAVEKKLAAKDFDFRGVWFPSATHVFQSLRFDDKVDFTRATFAGEALFAGTSFCEEVRFDGAVFAGAANFSSAKFGMAYATGAVFKGVADFELTAFRELAAFGKVEFQGAAKFFGARSEGWTTFHDASFAGKAEFEAAHFGGHAHFAACEFRAGVTFEGARFLDGAKFSVATFGEAAEFSRAEFGGTADFYTTTFCRKPGFRDTTFAADINFTRAYLKKGIRFFDSSFEEANFAGAVLGGEADFHGITFQRANFSGTRFVDRAAFFRVGFTEEADFFRSTFCKRASFFSVTFSKRASFSSAKFSEGDAYEVARFYDALFEGIADFSEVEFHGSADFHEAVFKKEAVYTKARFLRGTSFSGATFNEKANFVRARFEGGADYSSATFFKDAQFVGDEKGRLFALSADSPSGFQHARVYEPERFSFHTATLRPNWFMDIDARRFAFANVYWAGSFDQELAVARDRVASPYHLLAKTYRELAINAEENRRYSEASEFSYLAMEAQRKEKWRGMAPWRLDWWYWALSGYGERQLRAAAWLLLILLGFALVYTMLSFPGDQCSGLRGCANSFATQAIPYSLGAMTLQSPVPKPETGMPQLLVFLQGSIGPLQIALLALAVRRKFMR